MKRTQPPRFILRFLKWFCKPEYHADIEGDLLEFYDRRVADLGRTKANLRLFKDVLFLFRPGITRSLTIHQSINSTVCSKVILLWGGEPFGKANSTRH
jgi:putative ABC transport system permease protein